MTDDRQIFREVLRKEGTASGHATQKDSAREARVKESSSDLYRRSIEQINRTRDRDIQKALRR